MNRLEILAVVPARGGSKGLPGKNLREVGGRTLVARAVDAALESRAVTRVIGSTDSDEIATHLRDAGAEVPWLRPATLAQDDTPDAPVFLHVLQRLDDDESYRPDIVVNVRPTAPCRTGGIIDLAVEALLSEPSARSVKCVSEAAEHPYKMWTAGPGRLLEPVLPAWHERYGGNPDVPRQQLPAVYRSSAAVDAVWAEALRSTGMFHPGPVAACLIDAASDIDIDTPEDLRRAEDMLARRQQ